MIQVGDQLPNQQFPCIRGDETVSIDTMAYFQGRSILFGVPGAFTTVCSTQHLPGYLSRYDYFKSQGYDRIVCMGVNDPFVMKAWAQFHNALGKIEFLADGNATFTKALGLHVDLSVAYLGTRSHRFVMKIQDARMESLVIENSPSTCDLTAAQKFIAD